ncbi:MAG: ROK family protein [Anaerolineales bacterium]
MSDKLILALDVGGSSVKSAFVAVGPRIMDRISVDAIQSKASADQILNTLAAIIKGYLQNIDGVRGIAFAFPGPFDYERGICLIQHQDKYDALYGLDIGVNLKEILGLPTLEMRYRNDAEAAILGEALYGAGESYSRILGVTLGTGLGSAFIAEGNLITEGGDVPPHGWLYSCMVENQRADDVFSTRGLLARLLERGIDAVDVASVLQATDENSAAMAEGFASFGVDLGAFLAPFVSTFRAEAVLVTGGMAGAWECFAPSLSSSLSVPVLKGTLGRRAALLGAAALYF